MPAPILPVIASLPGLASTAASSASIGSTGGSTGTGGAFGSVFADAVQKVESFQKNADASINRFLSGEGEELHKVALAAQQADLSFQLFLQVRNKVVSAYQQVMQMQI